MHLEPSLGPRRRRQTSPRRVIVYLLLILGGLVLLSRREQITQPFVPTPTPTPGAFVYAQAAVTVYEAGVLCKDENVSASVRKREPVVLGYPKSEITSSLVAMSARLWKGSTVNNRSDSFFQKVANWFF